MFLLLEWQAGTSFAARPRLTKAFNRHECAYGNVTASIVERTRYPSTFMHELLGGSVAFGYGTNTGNQNDEFLQITVAPDGAVHITRDLLCTLPVFFGFSQGVFVVSNLFEEVVKRLPVLTLDKAAVSKCLLLRKYSKPFTMWKEIGILGEREQLVFGNGTLEKISAPKRLWHYNKELSPANPKDFLALFESRMERFVQTRLLGNNVAFEISGGLDSSVLPLYMAKKGYRDTCSSITNIYDDPQFAAQQRLKLQALASRTTLESTQIQLEVAKHYPLVAMLGRGRYEPIHILHYLYEAAPEGAAVLQAKGADIVVHGEGGDELFEFTPMPTQLQGPVLTEPKFVPFATQKLREYLIDEEPGPPETLLSTASLHENIVGSNMYIERGMWPVTPFFDLELFNFCQALPVEYGANKNILRAYYQANGFPKELYLGPNEDFSGFFDRCWNAGIYDYVMAFFMENSILHEVGLIDKHILKRLYETERRLGGSKYYYDMYNWLVVEINLYATANWRP